MFVRKVSSHCSGWLRIMCSDMEVASSKSGFPTVENLVSLSRAMPALFTSKWSLPSLDTSSPASLFTSSFELMSPGKATIEPGPELYFSTTLSRASSRRPVM